MKLINIKLSYYLTRKKRAVTEKVSKNLIKAVNLMFDSLYLIQKNELLFEDDVSTSYNVKEMQKELGEALYSIGQVSSRVYDITQYIISRGGYRKY